VPYERLETTAREERKVAPEETGTGRRDSNREDPSQETMRIAVSKGSGLENGALPIDCSCGVTP